MTSTLNLTDTQSLILSMASQRDDGRIVLPASLKGAAGPAVLRALERRSLIAQAELDPMPLLLGEIVEEHLQPYRVTPEGLKAIGVEPQDNCRGRDANGTSVEEVPNPIAAPLTAGVTHPVARRAATKRAQLIALLMEPNGATTASLLATLGWLPHTLRAALSGLRKVGREVVHEKTAQGEPAYRIVAPASEVAPR